MNKFVAILYAISCFTTAWISGNLLGVGMWFYIIMASGVLVACSQFFPKIRGLGTFLAALTGTISVIAVFLGLMAASIGGSFDSEDPGMLLLLSFFFIAVFGFTLVRINNKLGNNT